MFCTTKTAVDNTMMQPSGIGQRRSFLVLEEGEAEGTDGYWAEDDEEGAEGFLDGSKEDRPDEAKVKEREKEKEKEEENEGSSDQGKKKAEEKGEKAALTW